MKHAAGGRRIMQLRGPGSFQNDFDSAMLMAFKGTLVRISFLTQLYLFCSTFNQGLIKEIILIIPRSWKPYSQVKPAFWI
jgi:hypothetical protein